MNIYNLIIDNITVPFNNKFDWSQDNLDKLSKLSENKIWLHHFQSLRWIIKLDQNLQETSNEVDNPWDTISLIINSFLNFLIKNYKSLLEEKNFAVTNTWFNDHCTTIRLGILVSLYNNLKTYNLDYSIYDDILIIHIKVLIINRDLSKQHKLEWTKWEKGVYIDKHNHGLMSCLGIIKVLHKMPKLAPIEILDLSYKRYKEQIEWLWTTDGCTREHSLAYQSYNINAILELLEIIDIYGDQYECKNYLLTLINKIQNLILYSIQYDREFFQVGDTYNNTPHQHILNKLKQKNLLNKEINEIYFNKNFKELNDNIFCSVEAGYFIFRDTNSHLFLMASNFSKIHKHCDDLHVCYNINNIKLLVDAGYSDKRNTICHQTTSLRPYHNTVILEEELVNTNYRYQLNLRSNTKILDLTNFDDGYIVSGITTIKNTYFHKRSVIMFPKYQLIIIYDITDYPEEVYQIFNFGKEINIILNNEKMIIGNKSNHFEFITNFDIEKSLSKIWIDKFNIIENLRFSIKFLKNNIIIIKQNDTNIIRNINIKNNNKLTYKINDIIKNIDIT